MLHYTLAMIFEVYGAPVGIVTYLVAILASMGGFLFGWCVEQGWAQPG